MSKNICVYCSSSDAVRSVYFETARELGGLISKRQHTLVYGGASVGLMGEVAIYSHKGGAKVIGIMPEGLADKGISYEKADQFIVTKNMRERKEKMESLSDAFISLPGGFGTLEEILEILTLKQLQFHNKAVVIINTDGFYDDLINMFEYIYKEHFAKPDYRSLYFIAKDAKEAIDYIENYKPVQLASKWY